MTPDSCYVGNCRLELAKRIGGGGEGDVYVIANESNKAVKIFKESKRKEREAKIRAMVNSKSAQFCTLIAFPEETVVSRSGQFLGFTMRLFDGFRELHQLYSPKSRKIYYPNADFRFLVRAAANTARAVAQVHSSNYIIGDLNESGILVSSEATVAIIDTDSFQFEVNGSVFHCLVGKPEFTAPELQGKPLQGITRNKSHDNFGLGVAIFQLLFMGRHPYVGRHIGGDIPLDKMIAGNLFAYSQRSQKGLTPPENLPLLDEFTPEVAEGFEKSFGLDPNQRPSASDWVGIMQRLEKQLSRCSNNHLHYYPSKAKICPWCRMESATGAVLFLSTPLATATSAINNYNFDVEAAWSTIRAVVLPNHNTLLPRLPSFAPKRSLKAFKTNSRRTNYNFISLSIVVIGIAGWINYTEAYILWICVLFLALFMYGKASVDPSEWLTSYRDADKKWDEAVENWRSALCITSLVKLKNSLEAAIIEYSGLASEKEQALTRLKNENYRRQLDIYLDQFLIREYNIQGIGDSRRIILSSFGIESAADIKRNSILSIPGFGDVLADRLMAWRDGFKRKFVFKNTNDHSDYLAKAKLEADFARRATELIKKISDGQSELLRSQKVLLIRLQQQDQSLVEIAANLAQLKADLTFLGIPEPTKLNTRNNP